MNKKKKRSMMKTIIAAVVLATVCLLCAFVAYAYFSTRVYVYNANGEKEVAQIGMSLNLLFDKINSNEAKNQVPEGTDLGTGTPFDSTAEWGTAANPFIISEGRHLYNLSALQEIGYFYDLFINDPNETVPYFLVCDSDGTPQTIDGENMTISPIGTDTYPFRGYVGGAFIKKDENNKTITTTVKGNESDTSALCNVIVKTETDVIDVGLFGTVGYTGKDTNVKVDTTIENLVLCDVQVVVDEPTVLETFAGFMRDHFFSYDVLTEQSDIDSVPHENHHIGIFAGHVGYANVNYISVYYSDDSTKAIDLSHTKANYDGNKGANYASTTGIIGYMYNMNPDVDSSGMAVGGGISSNSLSMSNGVGSGGGLLSGVGRGYISAADIENAYGGSSARDADGNLLIKSAIDEKGNPLCQEWVEKIGNRREYHYNRYYFHDGVFTFALSSTGDKDTVRNTWEKDENGSYKPDSFSIGADNDSAWKKNLSEGKYLVSAFVKPVTDITELRKVTKENAPILILYKGDFDGDGYEDAFMLTLSDKSPEALTNITENNIYSVSGYPAEFARPSTIQDILDSANDDETGEDSSFLSYLHKTGDIYDGIKNGIEVLNFGSSDDSKILDRLKDRYNIDINFNTKNDTEYYHFPDGTPVYKDGNNFKNAEVVDHYYYYTRTTAFLSYSYSFYDETGALIGAQNYTLRDNFPTSISNDSGRYSITTNTTNGIGYTMTGPNDDSPAYLLYKNGETLYLSRNNTAANQVKAQLDVNNNLLLAGNETINDYLLKEVIINSSTGEETYKYYILNKNVLTEVTFQEESVDSEGNLLSVTIKNGKTTTIYPTERIIIKEPLNYFVLGATDIDNKLRIIEGAYRQFIITRYYCSLWCGPDDLVSSYTNNDRANIMFNDDGSCEIRYVSRSTDRYLTYNTTNFKSSNAPSSTTKMYIYTLEATTNIKSGHITYDPVDETVDAKDAASTSPAISFNAAEYVLWPNEIEAGATAINSPTYSIKSLKELAGEDATTGLPTTGWKNKAGQTLSVADLNKKFHMSSKINWTALQNSNYAINLWGFTIATEGFIKAPIGSNGDMANIPQGTVAFKINKSGESKIRVIVAVPQTSFSTTEVGHEVLEETYFALWKTDPAEQGFIQRFNRNNSIAKFKVPISEPYEPDIPASKAEHFTVNYNNKEYRMYMNGDRLLVAYEFTVNGEGVYVLGTTGAPMEIVYFSADGTASAGRDGTSGSMIGSIDFVYDYDGNIVTVKEKSSVTEPEDYHDYYATLCLLYTDNAKNSSTTENQYKFTDINNAQIKVRRFVADGKSQLNFDVDGQKDYIQFLRYAVLSDQINDNR